MPKHVNGTRDNKKKKKTESNHLLGVVRAVQFDSANEPRLRGDRSMDMSSDMKEAVFSSTERRLKNSKGVR